MSADSWDRARRQHREHQAAVIATKALELVMEGGASALTMADIAKAAEVSRQTLYRYYPTLDAVLTGIAQVVAGGDEDLARQVADAANPRAALDVLSRAVATAQADGHPHAADVSALLPPNARDLLADHSKRIEDVLAGVLRRGVEEGSFRAELVPTTDAPLILGLLTAASPEDPERAVTLVHQLVSPDQQAQGG